MNYFDQIFKEILWVFRCGCTKRDNSFNKKNITKFSKDLLCSGTRPLCQGPGKKSITNFNNKFILECASQFSRKFFMNKANNTLNVIGAKITRITSIRSLTIYLLIMHVLNENLHSSNQSAIFPPLLYFLIFFMLPKIAVEA